MTRWKGCFALAAIGVLLITVPFFGEITPDWRGSSIKPLLHCYTIALLHNDTIALLITNCPNRWKTFEFYSTCSVTRFIHIHLRHGVVRRSAHLVLSQIQLLGEV